METKKIVVGELKITREIISDGLKAGAVQLKVVPLVDKEGTLTGPLLSGFAFQVKPEKLIPADFDGGELVLKDPKDGIVRMGRPACVITGTVVLHIKAEREVAVVEEEKKHK
jgi:hypothetical protein